MTDRPKHPPRPIYDVRQWLRDHPGRHTAADIAKAMNITPHAATIYLQRLEDKGKVTCHAAVGAISRTWSART